MSPPDVLNDALRISMNLAGHDGPHAADTGPVGNRFDLSARKPRYCHRSDTFVCSARLDAGTMTPKTRIRDARD